MICHRRAHWLGMGLVHGASLGEKATTPSFCRASSEQAPRLQACQNRPIVAAHNPDPPACQPAPPPSPAPTSHVQPTGPRPWPPPPLPPYRRHAHRTTALHPGRGPHFAGGAEFAPSALSSSPGRTFPTPNSCTNSLPICSPSHPNLRRHLQPGRICRQRAGHRPRVWRPISTKNSVASCRRLPAGPAATRPTPASGGPASPTASSSGPGIRRQRPLRIRRHRQRQQRRPHRLPLPLGRNLAGRRCRPEIQDSFSLAPGAVPTARQQATTPLPPGSIRHSSLNSCSAGPWLTAVRPAAGARRPTAHLPERRPGVHRRPCRDRQKPPPLPNPTTTPRPRPLVLLPQRRHPCQPLNPSAAPQNHFGLQPDQSSRQTSSSSPPSYTTCWPQLHASHDPPGRVTPRACTAPNPSWPPCWASHPSLYTRLSKLRAENTHIALITFRPSGPGPCSTPPSSAWKTPTGSMPNHEPWPPTCSNSWPITRLPSCLPAAYHLDGTPSPGQQRPCTPSILGSLAPSIHPAYRRADRPTPTGPTKLLASFAQAQRWQPLLRRTTAAVPAGTETASSPKSQGQQLRDTSVSPRGAGCPRTAQSRHHPPGPSARSRKTGHWPPPLSGPDCRAGTAAMPEDDPHRKAEPGHQPTSGKCWTTYYLFRHACRARRRLPDADAGQRRSFAPPGRRDPDPPSPGKHRPHPTGKSPPLCEMASPAETTSWFQPARHFPGRPGFVRAL